MKRFYALISSKEDGSISIKRGDLESNKLDKTYVEQKFS